MAPNQFATSTMTNNHVQFIIMTATPSLETTLGIALIITKTMIYKADYKTEIITI